MITLEREFEEFKALHKYTMVKAKLVQFYMDLEADKPQLPDFMRIGQRPEDLADQDLRRLITSENGLQKFNKLYDEAYETLAEILD